jgi:hypothetical protein
MLSLRLGPLRSYFKSGGLLGISIYRELPRLEISLAARSDDVGEVP